MTTNKASNIAIKANYQIQQFVDQQVLAERLAEQITQTLENAIARNGQAVVAFSGGSTPKLLFKELAGKSIDWSSVLITLVDERWVPATHALSNEAFLKTQLLDHIDAQFVGLYQTADSVSDSLPLVLDDYCNKTNSLTDSVKPFDVAIMGMGGDGHTASFFPDAANISELVDTQSADLLKTCHSVNSQVERVTWSLRMLLKTDYLALHITGQEKQQVFQNALTDDNAQQLPIRSMLFQDESLLHVFYAD